MKPLSQIELEIIQEEKEIEEKAFELFCRDRLKLVMKELKLAEESLERAKQRKNNLTLKKLEEQFAGHDIYTDTSIRHKYIKMVEE